MMLTAAAITLWVLVIGAAEHALSGPTQALMAVCIAALVLWHAARFAGGIEA